MTNQELISILEKRFNAHQERHKDLNWSDILKRLNNEVLKSLMYMEETGGEPDIIKYDEKNDKYIFCDTSIESPIGRRSLCYDLEALNSRKNNKPISNIETEATKHNVEILTEEEYKYLQTLGDFDSKSTSWLYTPVEIRKQGGALFGDKKYDRTFIYHNGAESYYSNRGFRASLKI